MKTKWIFPNCAPIPTHGFFFRFFSELQQKFHCYVLKKIQDYCVIITAVCTNLLIGIGQGLGFFLVRNRIILFLYDENQLFLNGMNNNAILSLSYSVLASKSKSMRSYHNSKNKFFEEKKDSTIKQSALHI